MHQVHAINFTTVLYTAACCCNSLGIWIAEKQLHAFFTIVSWSTRNLHPTAIYSDTFYSCSQTVSLVNNRFCCRETARWNYY